MKLFETDFSKYDLSKITDVLNSGVIGFGENVMKLENEFTSYSNKKYNIATNSASAAAYIIFAYLNDKYGSCDVYTPSLAFTSPVWAAKHFGHNIIWVDVDNNLLFDVKHYKKERRLRCERYSDCGVQPVLMPILYGGVSTISGFDEIKNDGYNEIVVVDSAHCVTPTIKSDFIFFSFHPYKPIASSDGGMISTNNYEASEFFQSYRNFGRSPLENSYDINQSGFKFYMNNLNATIALESIKHYDKLLQERKERFISLSNKISMISHDNNSSYYIGTTLTDNADEIISKTGWGKHYPMLHKTTYWDNKTTRLPNLEKIHHKILNIPLHARINENICNC